MQTRITKEEMDAAGRQLAKSARGREVLGRLGQILEQDDLDLDLLDQRAFLALLGAVWTGRAVAVREMIGTILADSSRSE